MGQLKLQIVKQLIAWSSNFNPLLADMLIAVCFHLVVKLETSEQLWLCRCFK